jgi:cellulose synthase/poly-beta-1,6-N-acetylglucosamine synthase-like glycosyltransferase
MDAASKLAPVDSRYKAEPAEDVGRFGNTYLRWTLLHSLIVVSTCTMPLWLSALAPSSVVYVNTGMSAFFAFMWLWIACNALLNFRRMLREPLTSDSHVSLVPERRFRHIVVVPCYTDPIEILFDCLGSLLAQKEASKLLVVVAFEKKTPDLERKMLTVQEAFQGRFGELLINVHTIDFEREIPGGCSNKNCALRAAHTHASSKHADFASTSYTVTTCDTDSLFSPVYFERLEQAYNRANPVEGRPTQLCVWQAPLFYNWDLDKRPFFNRVTGIMRSLMMLGGLISFDLNPMSIFSYPLELGLEAGFINPRYSVDDIIFLVRVTCETNRRIPVRLLPTPVISGPTIGTTYWEEIDEWARQIRRWIVGSSESFHYFLTHFKGRPLAAGLQWFLAFFVYYAVLLCCAGVYGALAAVPLPWVEYPGARWKFAAFVILAAQYLVFLTAFVIDRMAVAHMGIDEQVSWLRNLAHLISAPVVLLVYNIIALYAVVKFVFRGKHDAGHIMAAKAGFGAVTEARQDEVPLRSTSSLRLDMATVDALEQSRSTSDKTSALLEQSPPESVVKGDMRMLCDLPEFFHFGSHSFDPRSVPAAHGPAFIYGAASP